MSPGSKWVVINEGTERSGRGGHEWDKEGEEWNKGVVEMRSQKRKKEKGDEWVR